MYQSQICVNASAHLLYIENYYTHTGITVPDNTESDMRKMKGLSNILFSLNIISIPMR